MSSRLSSLLVQDGLVTAKRVADAFQRQVIYGGTLDSNLLELKAVDEDDLIHYLGRADGMPTQPTGINGAGMPLPEVLEVFTREVAERFHAVPTKLLPGGVLRVLVADGVDLSEFDELAQCVQQRIEPWITLEFRFVEAMDKVYGAGTPSRYARLLTRSVQAHQSRDFPPARPIDPLPRFGSLASLRLVPEPPPPPVVARPPVDEPTTLMVAPALSSENTASLQIAAAVADGERTATMAVPTGGQATDTTSLAVPAGAAEATATMAVPPQTESTASLAVPPAIEVTSSMIVPPETTASLAVPPAIEVTSSMFVPPAVEATASIAVPPAVEATANMAVPATTPERATDAPASAAPQRTEDATVPAATAPAAVEQPVAKAAALPAAADSVPEFLPTVIIDPNSLNIDRSAPMKLGTKAPSAPVASPAAPSVSGLDDLSVADWMSAADWLSAANKVDALASARSPIPSVRSPAPVLPAALPEAAVAAVAAAAPPVSQPDAKLVDARTEAAASGQSAAAAAGPAATTPDPIATAAPVVVPVVEKSVQLTTPVAVPPAKPVETKPVETKPVETKPVETKPVETKPVETKPVETKPQQTTTPSRPATPPVETGGRKKGKKGKDGKQQGRQPAPTPPPVVEPQRRPQPAAAATPPTPAPQVQTPASAAPPSPPVQPSAAAAKPAPDKSSLPADSAAKPALPAVPASPSEAKAAPPPAAAKSGPVVPVAAASPAAASPSLAEPPQPSPPPSQPRSTEPAPKPEPLAAASAAPAKAAPERTPVTPAPVPTAQSKSAPERVAAALPSTQSAPTKPAPERQSGPSKAAPERAPVTPAPGATAPSKSAPERAPVALPSTQSAPSKPAPERAPVALPSTQSAPSKSAPERVAAALPSTQSAPSKAAPERATSPAQATRSTAPITPPTQAPVSRPAPAPSQPAPAATAAPAASATSGRPNLIPEPIPEPVNSGRLGEPILVKDAKPTPPMAVPVVAAAPPPAASTDSPIPPVGRPPRVATALDAGGFSSISLEAARELASSLEDRDAVFETLCRGARSRCAFAAVFTLHGEVAFGRVALLDDWLDRTQLGRISVQLDRPSPFRTAAKERTAFVGTVGKEGASSDPLRALNRSVPTSAAVLPVLVRGRAVALLYLDDEGGELTSAVLDELKPLLNDVGQAFLRIAQKNKAGGLGADLELGAIAEEQPAVETSAWRAPSGKSPRSQAPGESVTTPLPPSVPAAASPVPQLASEQPTVPLRVSPPAAATKQPAAAPASPPAADAARPAAVPDPIHFQPTVPVAAKAPAAAAPASSAKSPPGKNDKRGGKQAEAAPPPAAAKDAGGKPTLVELVERASNMDETAIEQLLAGGSEAARAVASALPGPLRSRDRQALGDPVGGPVYSRGPLLALALRMGQQAIEPMLARLGDKGTPADARYYLCLCFAEAPVAAAIGPLAECLYDGDDTVRLAAVTALRNFPPHPELSTVISKLRDTVDAGDGKRARFAVEALGELRISSAVPQLLNLLDHEDPALVDAVGRALQTITKQDFGRSRVRWTAWWRRSQDEPRLQWLLEGLTHSSAMLRSAAQDELTGLSGDVVGYRFDQPRRDREVARKRWAQWWQRRGYPVL